MAATYYVDGAVGNDANAGTSAGAGNAWATIAHATATLVNGDVCYIKASATYSISAGITFTSSSYSGLTQYIGYTTTPGDGGRATVQSSAGSITMFTLGQPGVVLRNLVIDGNNQTNVRGVSLSYSYCEIFNCVVKNCTNGGISSVTLDNEITECEITGCSGNSGAINITSTEANHVNYCWVHDNTVTGINLSSRGSNVIGCVISNNTGASSDGLTIYASNTVLHNVIHGNGRDGIRQENGAWPALMGCIRNNIITSNGGYGMNCTTAFIGAAATIANPKWDYNAFWSNTSGARKSFPAGAHDVALSGNPYANAAGNNFTLNNTAGAGAACRIAGFPGTLLGTTGYSDIGAFQHQDTGGGGTAGYSRARVVNR